MTGDDTGIRKFVTGDIAAVVDTSVDALSDIYNDDTPLYGLSYFLDEPPGGGCVAGSVGAIRDSLMLFLETSSTWA